MSTESSQRDTIHPDAAPVVSTSPVVLAAPGRGRDLRVRISAPVTGSELPVIVFSHGFGNSHDGYAPLVDHWAANGFVVIQPCFLDSRRLGLPPDDPRASSIWRARIDDVRRAPGDPAWSRACAELMKGPNPQGRVESKPGGRTACSA